MRSSGRVSVAVALSVAVHAAILALAVGSSLIGAWPQAPIDVEIAGMKMEDLTDLPLGASAPGTAQTPAPPAPSEPRVVVPSAKEGPAPAPKPPKPKPRPTPVEEPAAETDATPPPRPQSVRSYGPEGSRVTALLRIDRLRGTPYVSSVDALLMRLPDRRDLLEGTDLDLYRDVDALLLATPNPMDPAVTFLAVRHRLTDAALREALERGARATGRVLKWRTERGRPFAERLSGKPTTPPIPATPVAAARRHRDERLILLAAPRLAVVTPPAYRNLILRGRPASRSGSVGATAVDGGVGAAEASVAPDGAAAGDGASKAAAGGDAGANRDQPANEHADWAALIRRIDAEDSVMPANAVVMLSAEDVFAAPGSTRTPSAAVAGTRGAVDDGGDVSAAPARPRPTVFGMPTPRLITATLGIAPAPFSDVDLSFVEEGEAIRWETEWPSVRHKLLASPIVVLTGFSGLVGRMAVSRDGAAIHVHIDATELEMIQVLQLLATQVLPNGG